MLDLFGQVQVCRKGGEKDAPRPEHCCPRQCCKSPKHHRLEVVGSLESLSLSAKLASGSASFRGDCSELGMKFCQCLVSSTRRRKLWTAAFY